MANSNIFVVGLDEFHLAQLKALRKAKNYRFHPLFHYEEIRGVAQFPVKVFLREAEKQLKAFPDPVDAIVGYWDFPVSTLLPILRTRLGLLSPTLESVLKCEHKYWSRLEQLETIPDNVPCFTQVNPFAEDPLATITLSYPFWL